MSFSAGAIILAKSCRIVCCIQATTYTEYPSYNPPLSATYPVSCPTSTFGFLASSSPLPKSSLYLIHPIRFTLYLPRNIPPVKCLVLLMCSVLQKVIPPLVSSDLSAAQGIQVANTQRDGQLHRKAFYMASVLTESVAHVRMPYPIRFLVPWLLFGLIPAYYELLPPYIPLNRIDKESHELRFDFVPFGSLHSFLPLYLDHIL